MKSPSNSNAPNQPDLQELKRRVGLSPFAERITIDGGGFSPCPFHDGDGEESFHLVKTEDGAVVGTCFSLCGKATNKGSKSWDAIAFVQKFDGVDRDEAVRRVAASNGDGDEMVRLREKALAVPITAEDWGISGTFRHF